MTPLAVIFDLDGTLIDSEPWHKAAELEAFAHFGRTISVLDLMPYTGKILRDMLAGLAPDLSVDTFLEIERPLLAKHIEEQVNLFPDAVRLVDRISMPLALATSSMRWYVDAITAKHPTIAQRFPIRVCQADITHGKPNPEIMLLAATRLGVSPHDCWVIEDSYNGLLAAREAGCYGIGIDREKEGHLNEVADRVVHSLDEVVLP